MKSPSPAQTKKPLLTRKRAFIFLGAMVLLAIIVVASSGKNGSSTTTTTAGAPSSGSGSAKAAFDSWVKQVNQNLGDCVAGSTDVDTALGQLLRGSPTASEFVTASTAAKGAAPACSISSGGGVYNLSNINPPSGYPTLKSTMTDLQLWADQYNQQVIIDVGKVANSNGNSTSAVSSLITDAQSSDAQAESIQASVKAAAKQAGISNLEGLNLFTWGLKQK